jgi:predicted transcriptional regulator of viral defense system
MAKSSKKQQLIKLIRKKGIVRSGDIVAAGLPVAYLSRMAKSGELIQERHGLYHVPGYESEPSEHQSLIEVSQRIPRGVICLLSALRFHELTTQNPFEVWVAVENKSYLPKFDYPPVRVVYFSGAAFSFGVNLHNISGVRVRIFNEAKTIVDCFKYRNKIGLDVALEALREGWRQKRFRIDEINEYAEICRVKNVMRPYLEALV